MQDEQKTKSQLVTELKALRQEAARLESSLYECKQAEETLLKNHKASEMELRESEKQLTTLLNAITGIASLVDKDGTILVANNALAKSLGRKKEELVGHSMFEFVSSETAEKRKANLQKIVASKKPLQWENCRAERYFENSLYPISDDNGNVKQVAWFAEETTERKKTERTLKNSERKFRGLFTGISAGVIFCKAVYDENGNMADSIFKDMNPVYEKLANLKKETAIGRKVSEMLRGIGPEWFSTFGEVLKTGNPISFEMYHKNSKNYYSIFVYHSDKDEFAAIFEDITIRKKAEFALKESQNRFKALSEATFEAIFISEKGICIEANEAAGKMFGYSYSELIGIFGTDIIAAESKELVKKNMLAGYEKPYDAIAQRKDGSKFDVEILGRMFEYKGTNVRITALRDITERKKTEQALKKSEARFRQIAQNMPIMMDAFDDKGNIIFWNDECEKVTGFSSDEIVNNPDASLLLYPEENYRKFLFEMLKKYKSSFRNTEWDITCKNGLKKTVLWSNIAEQFPVEGWYSWAVGFDITDRKKAEKKIKKYAETQEVLAREVNHRVKNNLFAIIGMLHKEQKRALAQGLPSLPVIKAMEGRIRGLATVHGLLSQGGWQPLQLSALCEQIISATLHNLTLSRKADLNVAASTVFVNGSQAHYLAIVINELATNTIKHALSNRETVQINVDIKQRKDDVRICFCDDGPGYPQELTDGDFNNSGIGFELIQGIVRHSLRGEVRIKNDNGAKTIINFKLEI